MQSDANAKGISIFLHLSTLESNTIAFRRREPGRKMTQFEVLDRYQTLLPSIQQHNTGGEEGGGRGATKRISFLLVRGAKSYSTLV